MCHCRKLFFKETGGGNTLQEFSHALMDNVVKKGPKWSTEQRCDSDQIVEHVADCSLRRELKQFVRSHPTTTLMSTARPLDGSGKGCTRVGEVEVTLSRLH